MWRILLPGVFFWRVWFLDFLKDVPFIGPIIGGIGDYFAGERTNEANAAQAEANRHFQERMSSTSYQRSVADMQAAGLNPMLAYQQGGASSPGGSMATMQNTMSSAIHSAAAIAQAKAQTELTKAQRDKVVAETPGAQATSGRLKYELDNLVPLQFKTAEFENAIKQTEALVSSLEYNLVAGGDVSKYSKLVHAHFEAKYRMVPAEVRAKLAEATLRELDIARGRLLNKAFDTADRGFEGVKKFAEYAGMKAGNLVNSAVDAGQRMKSGYERFNRKFERRQHPRRY